MLQMIIIIDLLAKGISSSSTALGMIQELHLHSSCKCLSQLSKFCQLRTLCLQYVVIDNDDEVALCQLIEHQSSLRRVECQRTIHIVFKYVGKGSFSSLLLGLSSVEELSLGSRNINTELLPHSNTNLKKLSIHQALIQPLATLLPNITSLTYLKIDGPVTDSDVSVLITTIQSLHMLEVLHLGVRYIDASPDHNFSKLVEAAGNSQLKELSLHSCYYDNLPQHIQKHYNHLLKCVRIQF